MVIDKTDYGKTKIPISIEIFQLVRNILLSENINIQLRDILEIRRFLDIIDFESYTSIIENIPASDYLNLLDKLVNVTLENNAVSKTITIQTLMNESKDKEKFQVLFENKQEISNEDISYIKKFMADHVAASYIFSNAAEMTDMITKISSGDYDSVSEIVEMHKEMVFRNYKEINNIRVKASDEKLDSGLSLNELTNLASETIKKVSTPGFFINTGFRNLDNAMGGGLKRGTLTLFGARTAGFKSGIMLNLALSIKIHSKNLETFDKTKKACIVYLSMENTQVETFERVTSYCLNKGPSDLIDSDPNELATDVLNALNPATANPEVELKLLYKKSNTVSINEIESIVYDIENEGFEVVALFVDYLSTMNSTRYKSKDQETTSLAIADCAKDLYNLAIMNNICVISSFQLNRLAYNKNAVGGKDSLAYTGDSIKLATHANFIFVMNKSKIMINQNTPNEKIIDYIRFEEAKQRSVNASFKGYFYEIFDSRNQFRLLHSKYHKDSKGNSIDFEKFDELVQKYKLQEEANEKEIRKNFMNKVMTSNTISRSYDTSGTSKMANNINSLEQDNDIASF